MNYDIDPEPRDPQAMRIVELQRQLDRQKPVLQAALEAGRYWLSHDSDDLDDSEDLDEGDFRRLETLAEAVRAFDERAP